MKYLLDTSAVLALMRRETRDAALARVRAHAPGDVVTSALVAHELYFGALRSDRPEENRRELATLFTDLEPLPFTREDAEAAAAARVVLRATGMVIGAYDALIAGQALARGLVLVTNNGQEFERVEGLEVEGWA